MFWEHFNIEQVTDLLVSRALEIVLVSLLFLILYKLTSRIVRRLFKQYREKNTTDSDRVLTLSRMTTSGLHYFTLILYIYTLLSLVGIPVGSLLTGAGLLGAALAFSARDLVTDVINGFFIIVEHQVNVGEEIAFPNLEIEGTVTVVGIRSITLKTSDGSTAFVPNRNITALKNYSRSERTIFLDVPVLAEEIEERQARILEVNSHYTQVEFLGIVNVEEKLFLRSRLTAGNNEMTDLKRKILSDYYKNAKV